MTIKTRKLAGMLLLVGGLLTYVLVAAGIIGAMQGLPEAARLLLYAVAGIAWIFAARPVLVWMETGKWRVRRER